MKIPCGKRVLNCDSPKVMAVLNVTPDSFYDGGKLYRNGAVDLATAVQQVAALVDDGADIIDVGGESTRPGATPVSEREELDRVVPVVAAIAERFEVIVSVDTSCAAVMRESAAAGAGMINDVRGLTQPGALEAAAATGLAICLMHMQGVPATMQQDPNYADVTDVVLEFLRERIQQCQGAGIAPDKLIVDPGIGFGKNDDHNLALLRDLHKLSELAPVLLGVSRKSLFGRLLGREAQARLPGSLALALLAVQQGVSILRVHDVAATVDVIKMWQLIARS